MTIAIILTAILLLVGMAFRLAIPLFHWLYIPASVIAGFLGLIVVQLVVRSLSPDALAYDLFASSAEQWKSWPGLLIAIVFAGMLLERQPKSLGNSLRRAGREGLMVWIIVLGQTACGLLATWLFIQPVYGVPAAFGMLIETGFAGGHGTAAAMGQVFASADVGLPAGRDLGVMMATVGLVYGIISGVFWINVGVRRGWTDRIRVDAGAGMEQRTPMGNAVVPSDVIDPLLVQVIWLAVAFGIGMTLQWGAESVASWADPPGLANADAGPDPLQQRTGLAAIVSSFPLFIFTLFGGLITRRVLTYFGLSQLIDPVSIGRITSSVMDVLVVAAIASLNLAAVAQKAGPILILVAVAAIWTAVCLVVLSRRILPLDHWFELGLINYGMFDRNDRHRFRLVTDDRPRARFRRSRGLCTCRTDVVTLCRGRDVDDWHSIIGLGELSTGCRCDRFGWRGRGIDRDRNVDRNASSERVRIACGFDPSVNGSLSRKSNRKSMRHNEAAFDDRFQRFV